MDTTLSLTLPHGQSHYTTPRQIHVVIDNTVCRPVVDTAGNPVLDKDGNQYTLQASPLVTALLANAKKTHGVALERLTEAAMRYWHTDSPRLFTTVEYEHALFMLRYQFGQTLWYGKNNSYAYMPASRNPIHAERLKWTAEVYAYGVVVNWFASLAGISLDRFRFITGNDARADFETSFTTSDLVRLGPAVHALAPGGALIHLEVKGRKGFSSFDSAAGVDMLTNLAKKSMANPGQPFLGVVATLPKQSELLGGRARLLVADPGGSAVLSPEDQAVWILDETVYLSRRFGLWWLIAHAIAWRRILTDTEPESITRLFLEYSYFLDMGTPPRLYTERQGGRSFSGRIFSQVVERLGNIHARGMEREEAEQRLALRDYGGARFAGVDTQFLDVIRSRSMSELLSYGTRSDADQGLAARSAFLLKPVPMEPDVAQSVANNLRLALQRWEA